MEPKKSKTANIERSRNMYLQIGAVLVLSLVLIAFEWSSKPLSDSHINLVSGTVYEVEEIISTPRKPEPPKPLPLPKLIEMNLVPDDVQVDDIFDLFNPEATSDTEVKIYDYEPEKFKDDDYFIHVETMPLFNGGKPEIEFRKYIAENVKYPEIASEMGIKGKVYVQFIVNAQGKVEDARIISGVNPSLDNEALRVINSSPQWTPGKQSGKPVRVIFTFPINYVLK